MTKKKKEVPKYIDHCRHGLDCFIGRITIEPPPSKRKINVYDVYVYDTPLSSDVCIRYGNDSHEYISPGNVTNLMRFPENLFYRKALELILDKGTFFYRRKDNV